MRLARLVLMLALALAAPAVAQPTAGGVRAADYDAFWLWAGVTPQPIVAQARTLYLLRGQVSTRRGGQVGLISQIASTPHIQTRRTDAKVWIVYRVETLDWPPEIYAHVLADLARWRAAGNPVAGVQIDFDSHTRKLDRYAAFLADLRQRLPADCGLSITGLLDWSSQGDPAALSALSGVVDEVVLQTYQGRRTIPGYQLYMARLGRVGMPFKIGLIEGGEWTAPPGLAANPLFRGYVVFLRN